MSRVKITFAAWMLVGCAVEEPELTTIDDELSQPGVSVRREEGDPATAPCTVADVSEANFERFRQALDTDLLPKARIVASSPGFRSCLRRTMTSGQPLHIKRWNYPPYGLQQMFGPYNAVPGDLGATTTQAMPLDRRRDLYAARAMSEASSPHQIDITCMNEPGGAAGVPNPTFDRTRPEPMRLSKDFFNHDPAPTPANAPFRASLMAVIWHEAMHERGYWHTADTDPLYNTGIPNIVGACMEEAFAESETYCSTACPGGMTAMQSLGGDWGSCTCVRDPNVTPVLKDTWNWPGLTQVAVNGEGDGFVLAWDGSSQTAFERSGHSWISIGTANKIVAGGDAVAVRQPPSNAFYPTWWKVKSRVGGIKYVRADSKEQSVTMDPFGSLLRTFKGRVQRLPASVASWQDLGEGDDVIAGSDLVYRSLAGVTSRLDPGTGVWAVIGPVTGQRSVDTYGTLHVLGAGLNITRWRGSFWEWIGYEDTAIGTGDNLFTRSINGWVYRLAPGGWQAVAACDSFATGGRSMYCVRGTQLELYEY